MDTRCLEHGSGARIALTLFAIEVNKFQAQLTEKEENWGKRGYSESGRQVA